MLTADGGSFRDPSGRVYVFEDSGGEPRVVRGLTAVSAATVEKLLAETFFQQMHDDGDVAHTRFASPDDEVAAAVMEHGWASAVEHVPVEFLTWPYEWPFSMLQDAALLQLRLLATAVESGWMLKDAHPVQHPMGGYQACPSSTFRHSCRGKTASIGRATDNSAPCS